MTPALASAGRASKAARAPCLRLRPERHHHEGLDAQSGREAATRCTRILTPLKAYREDMLVLSGLADHNGNELGDGPGDHARAGASFLTGVHCRKTSGADIHNGVSADQIAAQRVRLADAVCLARTGLRGLAHRRQLRFRL